MPPPPRNIVDHLQNQIGELSRRLDQIQAARDFSMPEYRIQTAPPDDAVQNQWAMDRDSDLPYWYRDEAWHTFGSAASYSISFSGVGEITVPNDTIYAPLLDGGYNSDPSVFQPHETVVFCKKPGIYIGWVHVLWRNREGSNWECGIGGTGSMFGGVTEFQTQPIFPITDGWYWLSGYVPPRPFANEHHQYRTDISHLYYDPDWGAGLFPSFAPAIRHKRGSSTTAVYDVGLVYIPGASLPPAY